MIDTVEKPETARGRFRFSTIGRWVFALVLVLPSFFLVLGSPPLWRDSDGWAQITGRPEVLTLLHWPPAYCFGARVPLWLGTEVGAALGQGAEPREKFFREPNLTDGGIYGVIVAQHLLLVITLIAIIGRLSANGWLRLVLALIAVGQTPLYVYAQTVGSETLSAILTLAFLAAAFFLIIARERPGWAGWLVTGLLLFLLISTRHVNAVFCSVLPLYFLARMLLARWPWRSFSPELWRSSMRGFGLSLALGVATLLLTQGAVALVCQANGLKFRSCIGYTFQWRLMDVSAFDALTRAQVWASVLPHLQGAPELKKIITDEAMTNSDVLSSVKLGTRVRQVLDAQDPGASNAEIKYRADLQMNALTKAFILHAGRPFWNLVARNWWTGFAWTTNALTREPFATTSYFTWPGNTESKAALELRTLASFRWFEALGPQVAFDRSLYLRLFDGPVAVGVLLLAGLLCAVALPVGAGRLDYPAAIYLLSCVASVLLLWWCTKMLTHELPRFILPLYTVSVFVLLLGLAEVAKLLPKPTVRDSQKSSA